MNITRKLYIPYHRYITYHNFQSEFNKKIDDITLISSEKINESYNSTIDKLIESIINVEKKSRQAKLTSVDINVSISVGPINIGISKRVE
jgi:hypothetical protein